MTVDSITFAARGMELTEAITTYMKEKFNKVTNLQLATSISVEVVDSVRRKGEDSDFSVRVLAAFPKTVIRIKKEGRDLYALVDELVDAFQKKVTQYNETVRSWEGAEGLPKYEMYDDSANDESIDTQYTTYTPKIRVKKLENIAGMTASEAIQYLEFSDRDFYLYRDVDNKKLCVIYKDNAEYVLLVATE